MKISIISAIGKNNEIGKSNDLLWYLPADLNHFKEKTSNKTIIMGQKTFESLKTDSEGKQIGRTLPNRRNIIISNDESFKIEKAEVVYSIDELSSLLENTIEKDEEVFVIGGGMIYKIMLEKADKLYLTHVDAIFPEAEIFFPQVNWENWQKIKSEKYQKDEKNIYNLEFAEYIRK